MPPTPEEVHNYILLRRRILEVLYDAFREDSVGMVSFPELEESCKPRSAEELNWNSRYLDLKGFVDLEMVASFPPYIAIRATITEAGIDLVEKEHEFNRLFPLVRQEVNIHGPHLGHIQAQGSISGDIQGGQTFFSHLNDLINASSEISPEEKSNLLTTLNSFAAHPIISGILSGIALRFC